MKIIIRIYNLLCFPFSLIFNLILLLSELKNTGWQYIKYNTKINNLLIEQINNLKMLGKYIRQFDYIPDPPIRAINKLFKTYLTWNFIPFVFIFALRHGGDCSVFSRVIKRILKKQLNIKADQFLIYDNTGNIFEKLQTMHIVTTINYGKTIQLYNVNTSYIIYKDKHDYKESIKHLFQITTMVQINRKPYKYKKPVVMRWV